LPVGFPSGMKTRPIPRAAPGPQPDQGASCPPVEAALERVAHGPSPARVAAPRVKPARDPSSRLSWVALRETFPESDSAPDGRAPPEPAPGPEVVRIGASPVGRGPPQHTQATAAWPSAPPRPAGPGPPQVDPFGSAPGPLLVPSSGRSCLRRPDPPSRPGLAPDRDGEREPPDATEVLRPHVRRWGHPSLAPFHRRPIPRSDRNPKGVPATGFPEHRYENLCGPKGNPPACGSLPRRALPRAFSCRIDAQTPCQRRPPLRSPTPSGLGGPLAGFRHPHAAGKRIGPRYGKNGTDPVP
jgi:hypothetical protein